MFLGAEDLRDARGRGQLLFVPLAVVEGERVAGVSIAPRQREAGGGIESAAEQAHRFLGGFHEESL